MDLENDSAAGSQLGCVLHSEALSVATLGEHRRYQKALSKLDVLRARQIDRITRMNLTVLVLGLIWTVVYLTWAYTASFQPFIGITTDGRKVTVPSYKRSILMSFVDGGVAMTLSLINTVITPVYFLRVFRNNKMAVTSEQVMVGIELVMNLISINPIYIVYLLHDYVLYPNDPEKKWRNLPLGKVIRFSSLYGMYACWGCGIMLYTWVRLHMFSIFEKQTRWQFFKRIVFPKLLVALIYYAFITTTGVIHSAMWGFLPFTSLICVLRNRHAVGSDLIPFVLVVYACCITALELVMISGIVLTVKKTNRILRPLNYFSHRSRIVGFRFFVVHNVLYILGFTVCDNLIATAIPPGSRLEVLFAYNSHTLGNYDSTAMIFLMKIVWIVVTAYVSLPPDSIGFKGWFKSCDEVEMDETHRIDEADPVSLSLIPSTVTNPSIFGFRDVTLMFNLSWLAYVKNREDLDSYCGQLAAREKVEVIFEEKFETKVILVSLPDRIAVAFRGTTSTTNIMTDLKMALDHVNNFLPSRQVEPHPKTAIKGWMRAKLHHGFAVAYHAVAETLLMRIEKLLSEDRRPVYLTGHSLGGALATVCSLDLILCGIGLNADQVTVVTFGSPKCGDKKWAKIYNRKVPSNWNVKIESDVVAMLPRFPYTHIGKTALLTVGGNLLLDPSELESKWKSERPSLTFHKKPAYKMAFTIVCEKHLQGETPGIWDFPVAERDVRQWEENTGVTFNEKQYYSLLGRMKRSGEEPDNTENIN